MKTLVFLLLCLALAPMNLAAESGPVNGISSAIKRTGLPVPRFATLRSDEVNMRVGPGTRYPINWVYHRKGLPVEIIAEFDTWRRVRDAAGDDGWVHQATLSGKRGFIAKGPGLQPMYRHQGDETNLRAQVQPGAMGKIMKCEEIWCKVEADGIRGYMKKESLWGVYTSEKFD